MKFIATILRNIFSKELPKPVGRWRVENCNKQMNHKIDLSNEDHCGPCGQYALEKIKSKKKQPPENPFENTNNRKNINYFLGQDSISRKKLS
jgi:hypothetical protein